MRRITPLLLVWLPLVACTGDVADDEPRPTDSAVIPDGSGRPLRAIPPAVFGCYELDLDEWEPPLTTGSYELPDSINMSLDRLRDDELAAGFAVYPDARGPDGAPHPGRWTVRRDSVAVLWTDATTWVVIAARFESRDSIAGTATALHSGGTGGTSEAPIVLRRFWC